MTDGRTVVHIALLVTALLSTTARACLWDYDTITDERRGLPGVAEIIAGRWERHSPAFYRQRIAAMQTQLAGHPDDWPAWDNLAVAYEKVGHTDQAIKTILDKDARSPGQYTTEANLGTFYIHSGDYGRGIEHIKKAMAIKPDAHFGREKYQLMVAEFLQHPPTADADGASGSFVVPMLGTPRPSTQSTESDYLTVDLRMRAARLGHGSDKAAIDSAVAGAVGMIRFGNAGSPHLYYALGDLLAARGNKNMAYRAYLRAIELNPTNPKEIRAAADGLKNMIYEHGDLEAEYAAERTSADAWVAAYQAHEQALLAAGSDAEDDANYADFYAAHGSPRPPLPWQWPRVSKEAVIVGIAIAALVGYLVVGLSKDMRRRRASPIR